jgi:hypothetical protein
MQYVWPEALLVVSTTSPFFAWLDGDDIDDCRTSLCPTNRGIQFAGGHGPESGVGTAVTQEVDVGCGLGFLELGYRCPVLSPFAGGTSACDGGKEEEDADDECNAEKIQHVL